MAKKLIEDLKEVFRAQHYAYRTKETYLKWIKRFIAHNGNRHPGELGAEEIQAFLTHLAVDGKVSASSQNQALSALLFMYKKALGIDLPWMDEIVRARRPKRVTATRMFVFANSGHRLRIPPADSTRRQGQ